MQAGELSDILTIFTARTGVRLLQPPQASANKSAINEILRLDTEIGDLALRVRVNEAGFQYEDVVKEPVIHTLLSFGDRQAPELLSRIGEKCLAPLPAGRFGDQAAFIPELVYYMNRPASPHPVSINRWVEGELLWDHPSPERYKEAGALLAKVHASPCPLRGTSLKSLSEEPFDVTGEILLTMEKLAGLIASLSDAHGRLASKAVTAARPLAAALSAKGARAVLCHGDYHGGNLIRGADKMYVLDWDNAVFGLAEMDLVKMRYWTARKGRRVSHAKDLCDAFRGGYEEALRASGRVVDKEAERLSELLWLLRVLRFEIAGRRQKESHVSYGSVELYTESLERLTNA